MDLDELTAETTSARSAVGHTLSLIGAITARQLHENVAEIALRVGSDELRQAWEDIDAEYARDIETELRRAVRSAHEILREEIDEGEAVSQALMRSAAALSLSRLHDRLLDMQGAIATSPKQSASWLLNRIIDTCQGNAQLVALLLGVPEEQVAAFALGELHMGDTLIGRVRDVGKIAYYLSRSCLTHLEMSEWFLDAFGGEGCEQVMSDPWARNQLIYMARQGR